MIRRTASESPELTSLIRTPAGEQSVDFANPQAAKAHQGIAGRIFTPSHTAFRRALYASAGARRADYIHHLAIRLRNDRSIPAQATIPGRGRGATSYLSAYRRPANMAGDFTGSSGQRRSDVQRAAIQANT